MALTTLSLQWGASFSTDVNTNLVGYPKQATAWFPCCRSAHARASGAPGPMNPRLRCCYPLRPTSTPHAGVAEFPYLVTSRCVAETGHPTAPGVDPQPTHCSRRPERRVRQQSAQSRSTTPALTVAIAAVAVGHLRRPQSRCLAPRSHSTANMY